MRSRPFHSSALCNWLQTNNALHLKDDLQYSPCFIFFSNSRESFEGINVAGATRFLIRELTSVGRQWDFEGEGGGEWIFMKGREPFEHGEHSSYSTSHTHRPVTKSRTLEEVQGLVPYQQAHIHLTLRCSHSHQKRMLIIADTHTDTHTPPHAHANKHSH